MDVVIPLGKGSRNNDIELRYCLRGIEKYVNDLENIFIIGEKPSFLRNIIHVPTYDMDGAEYKERNIFSKILIAANDKRVSDDFLFFNDDHFLLMPWITDLYHHKGPLSDTLQARGAYDTYRSTLTNTLALFPDGMNFDTHCPIVYNKELFKKSVGTMDWYRKAGYLIKSAYCNMNGITGEYYRDLKISKPFLFSELQIMIRKRPYFSVGDHGLTPVFINLLEELYPQPSAYES